MTRRVSTRAVLVGVGLAVAAALAVLTARGLGSSTVYYYAPREVAARAPSDRTIRVGGTVVPGTIRFDRTSGVLRFRMSDGRASIAVVNRGAPPQLFTAGRQALVEGRWAGGVLRSSDVIVKHDENYRAPAEGRS